MDSRKEDIKDKLQVEEAMNMVMVAHKASS
jgi:hypothetical protein